MEEINVQLTHLLMFTLLIQAIIFTFVVNTIQLQVQKLGIQNQAQLSMKLPTLMTFSEIGIMFTEEQVLKPWLSQIQRMLSKMLIV